MPLHDEVGINVERAQLPKIKGQVSSMCDKGCMLDDYVCVI